jgi:hypothetical protein
MSANLNVFGGISEKIRETFAETWRRNAVTKIQRQETAREFGGLILGFVLLRLATSAVSIFSGWAFFNVELSALIANDTARELSAVALLAIIEAITAGFLFKFFKFIFAHRWGVAGAMLAGVAVFFFVSFHTSTRGIALYKSDTTNKNVFIEQKAAAGVDSITNYYNQQIELLKISIAEIRPQTWNKRHQTTADGRDTTIYLLTTAQENTKTELYNKIIALQAAQSDAIREYRRGIDTEKQTNQAAANVEADKYFLYVAMIMLLQLSANGVLCFFYSRIYHENNRADEIAADVADFAAVIADNTDALINRQTTTQYNQYLNGLERRLLALQAATTPPMVAAQASNETAATVGGYRARAYTNIVSNETTNETTNKTTNKTNEQPTNETAQRNNVIIKGFVATDEANNETNQPTKQPTKQPTNETGGRVVYVGIKHCAYCGAGFIPNHSKQIYCCNEHRGQACANRNGRAYWFAGVKYEPEQQQNNHLKK